jgi:IS30 family transposase
VVLIYFAPSTRNAVEPKTAVFIQALIRQYIPKGKDFDNIDTHFIKIIEGKLNNRPRKILNFLTPKEFYETINYKMC